MQGQHPGYPVQTPAPRSGREGRGLGLIAVLIAGATFALNLLVSLLAPLLYSSAGGFETFNAVSGVVAVVSFLAYAAALVLGLLAVKRAGSPLLAGVAIGIAGAGLLGLVVNFVASFFYRFM
ncbi:hypothetical protein D7252_03615 [Microbacterium sp. CGR2]|nr:hypothetical protein D7252_03615 [Microbacterium sp. CGR2]